MTNNKFKMAFAGILAGMVFFWTAATAGAASMSTAPVGTSPSVCDTGYRGMPEYDRKCLRTGTVRDAFYMWASMDRENRKYVCRNAKRMGVMNAAKDFYFDGVYDTFRNHKRVLFWLGMISKMDCRSMGYRV